MINNQHNHHNHRPTLHFFICVAAVTLAVILKVELPLLLGMNAVWERKIDDYRWILHLHAALGSLALLSGPLQFFTDFRNKHLALHKLLGYVYALSVLISAPIGIYIALTYLPDGEKWAAAVQGSLWLGATVAAIYCAVSKQRFAHKVWITHSYALTLTFILTRFIMDVLKIEVSPDLGGNAALIWASTVIVIIIADHIADAGYETSERRASQRKPMQQKTA